MLEVSNLKKIVVLSDKSYSQLELNPLPPHLKYVFLDVNKTYLVIIFSSLRDTKIDKLWGVLKDHKSTVA